MIDVVESSTSKHVGLNIVSDRYTKVGGWFKEYTSKCCVESSRLQSMFVADLFSFARDKTRQLDGGLVFDRHYTRVEGSGL